MASCPAPRQPQKLPASSQRVELDQIFFLVHLFYFIGLDESSRPRIELRRHAPDLRLCWCLYLVELWRHSFLLEAGREKECWLAVGERKIADR